MIFLILDTNIWLYLANGFDSDKNTHEHNLHQESHIALLQRLKNAVETGEVRILINDIILDEWKRNEAVSQTLISILERKKEDIKNAHS